MDFNVALLCLHPFSKKFDICWTRFREFEPKVEGRRAVTARDLPHLLHIGEPYKRHGDFSTGLSDKETSPYAWERLLEGLPRFPKLTDVEYEHFIT